MTDKTEEEVVAELMAHIGEQEMIINELRTSVLALGAHFRKLMEYQRQGFTLDLEFISGFTYTADEARKSVMNSFGRKGPATKETKVN